MASLYDSASLVMIPSGYKEDKIYSIKPTDGSGDLTFSRSNDTATRVNSDGLIEKVRTNVILESNSFDTTWIASGLSRTANTTANPLDGQVNAYTFSLNSGTSSKFVTQSIVQSGVYTQSVYLKAGTHQFIQLLIGSDASTYTNFDLVNGTKSVFGSNIDATIELIGSGWYRCSMTYNTSTGSDVYVWAVDSLSASRADSSSSTGNFYIYGFQLESGLVATDYIPTTTAAVSVGPVANLPRLDYLDSSCPKLLLEPQRTNLIAYSEQFDNATWIKLNISATANQATSPDGYTNADDLANTSTTDAVDFYQTFTTTAASVYTLSCFAKSGTFTKAVLRFYSGQGGGQETQVPAVTFDLDNGVVLNEYGLVTDSSITSYGNGWYRLTLTSAAVGTTGFGSVLPLSDTATWNTPYQYPSNFGSLGNIQVYGCQAELASYATSYIPTFSAASTRGADVASKTSASALIGQTEGTLFFDIERLYPDGARSVTILWGGGASYVQIFLVTDIRVIVNGTLILQGVTIAPNTRYKLAVAYKNGSHAMYVNGVQINTSASSLAPTVLNDYYLGNAFSTEQSGVYNQALLFPTRLSNAELASLTSL